MSKNVLIQIEDEKEENNLKIKKMIQDNFFKFNIIRKIHNMDNENTL